MRQRLYFVYLWVAERTSKFENRTKKGMNWWRRPWQQLCSSLRDKKCVFQKKRTRENCNQRLFEENVRKTKKKVCGLQIKGVWELFMRGKGISTPRIRHKGRQPLIKCEERNFDIIYFPFLCFFIFFWVDKGVALVPTYPQVRWGIQTYVVLLVWKFVC